MADRSEVQQSAAYAALSVGGKRVLHVIEEQVGSEAVALSLEYFVARGMCRTAARIGIKQCELVGFVTVSAGPRSVGVFRLADGWRGLDAVEAKRLVKLARLPMPPRESIVPPKPPKAVKAPKVEWPRTMQRRMPSLPSMPWQDDGR